MEMIHFIPIFVQLTEREVELQQGVIRDNMEDMYKVSNYINENIYSPYNDNVQGIELVFS